MSMNNTAQNSHTPQYPPSLSQSSTNVAYSHSPAQNANTLPPSAPSSAAKVTSTGDVRPPVGRVGSLGLQQLFPQRDPATINAVVSAASGGVPFTPPPVGAAISSHSVPTVTTEKTATATAPAPNLFVDG